MKAKTPKLIPVDLSKCCAMKGAHAPNSTLCQFHPDIKESKTYLAQIDGGFFVGQFSLPWYGWSFDGWGGGGGLQLDKPGTNHSMWQGLWEIKVPKR